MHGVTKPVVIHAAFLGAGPDLQGTTRAGFEGSTTVDRKDYGIVWNKTLDQGGTYLGDDVTISLQIEGVVPKADSAPAGQKAQATSGKSEKKEATAKTGK